MTNFRRGDVVTVDLGYVGKVRSCVVVSDPKPDPERAMCVVVPITTQARGGPCEVPFPKPNWMNEVSVVNLLGIVGVDHSKIIRRLAPFPDVEFNQVLDKIEDIIFPR